MVTRSMQRQLLLTVLVTLLPLCAPSVIRRPALTSAGASNPSAKETVIVVPGPGTTPAPAVTREPGDDPGTGRRLAVSSADREARIINYQSDNYQDGYHFQFETTNGIKHEEVGQVFSGPLPQTGVLSTEGRSSWHDPTGMQIVLYWHADENGYQPLGIKMISKHHQPSPELREIEKDFKLLQALRENRLNPSETDADQNNVREENGGFGSQKHRTPNSQNTDENSFNFSGPIVNPSASDNHENSIEPDSLSNSLSNFLDLPTNTVNSGAVKELIVDPRRTANPANIPTSSPISTTPAPAGPQPSPEPQAAEERAHTDPQSTGPRAELKLPTRHRQPVGGAELSRDRGERLLEAPVSDSALLKLAALADPSATPPGKHRKRVVRKVIRKRIIKL